MIDPKIGHSDRQNGESAILHGNIPYIVFVALFDWSVLKKSFSFIFTVLRRFFIDQFVYKMNPGRVPLRNIEHPLDAAIPVRYETVGVYLSFIHIWISALSYLRHRLGPDFNDSIVEFLDGLSRCYTDAATVYARCLSTTRRPERAPNSRLAFVYAVDPHLFCVPSIHVLVVCYTYGKIAAILRNKGLEEEYLHEIAALRTKAIAITESILYVRQHSLNCIPTALSMLPTFLPSYTPEESKAFLAELFAHDEALAEEQRGAVLAYMMDLYERMVFHATSADTPYSHMVDFLMEYRESIVVQES